MNRRWGLLICLLLVLTCSGPVFAVEEAGNPEVKLRGWFLGVQGCGGDRDRWDVFGQEGLPPAPVKDESDGLGFFFGHRFGGRFLLGLQLAVTRHEMEGVPERLLDTEILVTGTVLFRERRTLQPFLRGGLGANGLILEGSGGNGRTMSLGPAVVAGGGLQVRLSSRFSLEWEIVGTFTNFLEVYDHPGTEEPDRDWRVDTSNMGVRTGIGVLFWF